MMEDFGISEEQLNKAAINSETRKNAKRYSKIVDRQPKLQQIKFKENDCKLSEQQEKMMKRRISRMQQLA